MGGIRKLFINEKGLDKYAKEVYEQSEDMKDVSFADLIECKEYIKKQLIYASKLNKIASISIIEEGLIRFRTKDLFITTNDTGKLRRFHVGKWLIEVEHYGDYRFKPKDKKHLGFNSTIWGNNTVHPHVSGRDGHACLGNAEAPLQMYIKTGAIKALAMYLIGYLESVNIDDSAGVNLGHVHECKLDEEGNPIKNEQNEFVYVTNEFNENVEFLVGTIKGSHVDKIHNEYLTRRSASCEICGNGFNYQHISNHDGHYICETCKDSIVTCDICNKILKADNTVEDTVNHKNYCKYCAENFFDKCNLCNEYIFPKLFMGDKDILYYLLDNKNDEDIKKQHNKFMKTSNNTYKQVKFCDKCNSSLENIDTLKQKLMTFNKAKIDTTCCRVLWNIPLNTYVDQCNICGRYVYVENILMNYSSITTRRYCSACYARETIGRNYPIEDLHRLPLSARIQYVNHLFVNEKAIKVLMTMDYDKYKIKHIPFTSDINGKVIPHSCIKDISLITNEEIDIEINNTDNRVEFKEPEHICPVCKEKIKDINDTCKTNDNTLVHKSCANSIANRCIKCNKTVKITELSQNISEDLPEGICRECLNQSKDCPYCGNEIEPFDETYTTTNGEVYHHGCAEEADIIIHCDSCGEIIEMDNACYCPAAAQYYCENCISEGCEECNETNCEFHPDNR